MSPLPANRVEEHYARLGLRPSRAKVCPRVVAGLRCRYQWAGEYCPCPYGSRVEFSGLLDHVRIWNSDAGHVFTAEPYGIEGLADKLARFIFVMKALGLSVEVRPDSPWAPGPGGTTSVIVRRVAA